LKGSKKENENTFNTYMDFSLDNRTNSKVERKVAGEAVTEEVSIQVEHIAERLRKEPFHMLRNNCLLKSLRFRKECRKIGVGVRIVFALVLTPCARSPLPPWVVWFHAWAEIKGQRIELARPLDERNAANSFDIDIRPIIGVWI